MVDEWVVAWLGFRFDILDSRLNFKFEVGRVCGLGNTHFRNPPHKARVFIFSTR
jgi:hypothetical protein